LRVDRTMLLVRAAQWSLRNAFASRAAAYEITKSYWPPTRAFESFLNSSVARVDGLTNAGYFTGSGWGQLRQHVLTCDDLIVRTACVFLDRGDEVIEVVVGLDTKRHAARARGDASSSIRRAVKVEDDTGLVTDNPGVVIWANNVGVPWSEVALLTIGHLHVKPTCNDDCHVRDETRVGAN
jgi:hypothetical protein